MHTLTRQLPRRAARAGLVPAAIIGVGLVAAPAGATMPTAAPQVLLAITNSESMDGNTAGAIMMGSGALGASLSQLQSSSSPVQYSVPSGFVPPVQAASNGLANYTATCTSGTGQCDNGASRMNMTKAAIKSVLASYGSTISFGVYDYSTSGTTLYATWVYQMSPSGGFTFTNTASTAIPSTTVPNPCYGYLSMASGTVKSNCTSLTAATNANPAGPGFASATLNGNLYMNVSASSDNPQVNDVLYAGSGGAAVFVDFGQVSPANPYSGTGSYSLSTYNNNPGGFSETYPSVAPANNARQTTPTNAGFVPYSTQVMYVQRGFGYGGSQSATTGNTVVPIGTDYTTTAGLTAFNNALAPETNIATTAEIKSVAGQSALAGLMKGAKTYLGTVTHQTCQSQYVVLMTDGLPTIDLSSKTWPPLGTITANAYSLTASYDTTGAFISSNSQAVTDAVAAITALNNAGIKVYVIGLGAGVDRTTNPSAYNLLQAMAIAGGTTSFFPANDPNSLNNAFQTIVAQIYASSSVAAPLVPRTVQSGSAFEYMATSTSPSAGHVAAFPVDSTGTPTSAAPTWTTDNTMTASDRSAKLLGGDSLTVLSSLTDTDFNLPAASSRSACVPDRATIVAYTVNPDPTGLACAASTYLNGRNPNILLGAFSQQDSELYLAPPGSALLTQNTSYLTWARSHAGRPNAVLFTSEDGFLYSINAATGVLNWGWINKYNLTQLQNFTTFQAGVPTNGDFSVVDAFDGSAWGSYIVGSMNSGGTRFSLKLDDNGKPSSVVYDNIVGGTTSPTGTSAGDVVAATGNAPLRQPPVIAYVGTSAYTIYAVTSAGVSTLYETNVATGVTTQATLSFVVSSSLYVDSGTNQLLLGSTAGGVYATVATGVASADLLRLQAIGTTVNPANGSPLSNVQWVSYFTANGIPYFYAANSGQITLFGSSSTGWVPLWSASATANYTYTAPVPASGSTPAVPGFWTQVNNSPNLLTTGGIISDMPLVIGQALLVPVYVAGTGCSLGTAYYDFFALGNGNFPTQALTAAGLSSITSDMQVGQGVSYTPSVTVTSSGYDLNASSSNNTNMQNVNVIKGQNRLTNASVSWRQH